MLRNAAASYLQLRGPVVGSVPHVYTNGIAIYFEDAALGGASGSAVVGPDL